MEADQIEAAALSLDRKSRARIAERLLASLDYLTGVGGQLLLDVRRRRRGLVQFCRFVRGTGVGRDAARCEEHDKRSDDRAADPGGCNDRDPLAGSPSAFRRSLTDRGVGRPLDRRVRRGLIGEPLQRGHI